jgi:DNA-binding NtrC family response regulator
MPKEILLIDDDADELEILTDAIHLVDKNITCAQMKNLNDAREYLKHHSPCYVFIDLNMPTVNGVDHLAELKKLGLPGNSRIVLYSNYIDDDIQRRAIDLGAYRVIKKPNMIDLLARKLKEVLQTDHSS